MDILRQAGDDVDLIVEARLDKAKNKIKDFKEHVSLKGKNVEVVNVEQAAYLAYYDEIRVELKALLNYYELRCKEVKAQAWKTINEHSRKDHSDREKEILVSGDPAYMKINRTFLYVKEMYEELDSICEQFKNRAFTINNIVKMRCAMLEGISIYD